ncbi:glucose-1-phosphate cytidylyltransferase [Candidatus Protofrankia californiensis]|uniref:glucose-1-phosphate cytidylyltransferase n=1 Tax=Candidatus Protofrankia californiensis TaxID=1839754 RepID=UPI00104144E3|nr:glucose-1-phosphate cytidylyltransferase [Candidatus Protofrankia californiensis]
MKVVLFCGGRGERLLDGSTIQVFTPKRTTDAPKPMHVVGDKPILWHLMKWYATHGHTDFILCVGFRGEFVRDWVSELSTVRVDEPTALPGVPCHRLLDGEAAGWSVTVVDSGLTAPVGQRLRAVRDLVGSEELFLANYADGLSDVPLPEMIEEADRSGAVATLLAVRPPATLHAVGFSSDSSMIRSIAPLAMQDVWVNAGFFVLRPAVFDVIGPGEDLVDAPFGRLAQVGRLGGFRYSGFWRAMDTAKDRLILDELWCSGVRPWAIWEHPVHDELVPSQSRAPR